MRKDRAPVTGPVEFFQELADLFRQLEKEKKAGRLTLETQDALARVLSYQSQMIPPLRKIGGGNG